MVLENFGSALKNIMNKIASTIFLDKSVIEPITRMMNATIADIQSMISALMGSI